MKTTYHLIKAINNYIAKTDDDLIHCLSTAGFINATVLTSDIITIEQLIAHTLLDETRFIRQRLAAAVDLAPFAANWPDIKLLEKNNVYRHWLLQRMMDSGRGNYQQKTKHRAKHGTEHSRRLICYLITNAEWH